MHEAVLGMEYDISPHDSEDNGSCEKLHAITSRYPC
jgi:hypothetical protein